MPTRQCMSVPVGTVGALTKPACETECFAEEPGASYLCLRCAHVYDAQKDGGGLAFEDLPDTSPAGPADTEAYPELVGRLRRVLARLSELGEPVAPSTFEAAEEPALGTYQLAALGPFGSYDRQRVLEATSVASRRALLDRLLAEVSEDVDRRLTGEGPGQRR